MTTEHFDVLIVGAGLSGIGAGYYLQAHCPGKSYAILEARETIGGTWDLFRYPGVRSDSDMYTLGFSFRPWRDAKAIADGPAILSYIKETAQAYGIDRKIRFGHRVRRAEWSSVEARWTVEVEVDGAQGGRVEGVDGEDRIDRMDRMGGMDGVNGVDGALAGRVDGVDGASSRSGNVERDSGRVERLTCGFLYMCTGYYDYERGYTPEWAGVGEFGGRIVHPQQWPEDLDYTGKRVIVIGSGATAVTLVPAMAERAGHVTMLQRSPTYIVARPARDPAADWLRGHLPQGLAYGLVRWKNVLLGLFFYKLLRGRPERAKRTLVKQVRDQLGPDFDVGTHFTPRYNPWDQRLCLAPDGDLFKAISAGKASVATGEIECFTPTGIQLRSGEEVNADIIITATGLVMKLMSGVQLAVDGAPVTLARTMNYKGAMFSDIPNLAEAMGYTQASWTLKCELISRYVCRLLNYMDRHGYVQCTPRRRDPSIVEEPVVNLTSGYVQRALASLPKQGSRRPWKMYQNYLLDTLTFRFGRVDDGTMEFR